jgi:hypothetical protein
MKSFNLFRYNLIYCFTILVTLCFVSCDKDDDNNKLTLSKKQTEVYVEKSDKISVSGGTEPYKAVSADTKIATVSMTKSEITVTGVKKGNTEITVTDKNGTKATFPVTVADDPTKDNRTRFTWNTSNIIEGTDKGTYKLSQGKDGKVEFSWKSEEKKKSVLLSFPDKAGKIEVGSKSGANLTIDNKTIKLTSLNVIQTKEVKTGEKPTIWISFKANDKIGICVGKLAE